MKEKEMPTILPFLMLKNKRQGIILYGYGIPTSEKNGFTDLNQTGVLAGTKSKRGDTCFHFATPVPFF